MAEAGRAEVLSSTPSITENGCHRAYFRFSKMPKAHRLSVDAEHATMERIDQKTTMNI